MKALGIFFRKALCEEIEDGLIGIAQDGAVAAQKIKTLLMEPFRIRQFPSKHDDTGIQIIRIAVNTFNRFVKIDAGGFLSRGIREKRVFNSQSEGTEVEKGIQAILYHHVRI